MALNLSKEVDASNDIEPEQFAGLEVIPNDTTIDFHFSREVKSLRLSIKQAKDLAKEIFVNACYAEDKNSTDGKTIH